MAEEGDRIEMSQRERDRLRVLRDVKEGRFSQVKAAELVKLTVRQLRRLQQRWRQEGDGASRRNRCRAEGMPAKPGRMTLSATGRFSVVSSAW